MRALEPLAALRVVAEPTALDDARWQGDEVTVLRFAPDDAFAIGAEGVEVDDEHAIIEPDAGYSGTWVAIDDVAHHVEWSIPHQRPALAQGSIAGVPAKLWLPDDGPALLLTATAYADELTGRLR